MRNRASVSLVAIAVAVRAFVGTSSPAHAQVPSPAISCLEGITREARKFVQKKLRTYARCNNDNLKAPDRCPAPDLQSAIADLETNLRDGIGKKCAYRYLLEPLGYPGLCNDADPSDDFTIGDLEVCIATSHEAIVDNVIDITYGTAMGPLGTSLLRCQAGIANAARTYAITKLKLVQRCETSVVRGQIVGIRRGACATADPTTAAGIAEAESKARARIALKCTDDQIAILDMCRPHAITVAQAEDCILETYGDAVDSLIGIEYPTSAPPVCGNDLRSGPEEECDGTDDAECPGECGPPDGAFPCLCLTIPRERVIEHANADLDIGWTGTGHDMHLPERGGYVVDLYDCDRALGDSECTVGPSCSAGAHAPCVNDAQCSALGQDTCRKRRTAVGPHCNLDIQVPCTSDAECPGTRNYCVKQWNGPPVPLAAGGIAVCVLNVFSEDIVGTTNLVTGEGQVRLRQNSNTFLGGAIDQPCPVCGGFCGDPAGGTRRSCSSNADCAPGVQCVTDAICSFGSNVDKACRPDPPYGGPTALFGTTSVDCPPDPLTNISSLDILFDPRTTGTVMLTPSVRCGAPDFAGNACIGGPNDGRPCAAGSDCPSGTCSPQCFCPGQRQPNDCGPACVGGPNDAAPCGADSDCADGFCHPGDCRLNPADTDSAQEGRCSVPSGRECFVNSGVMRQGSAGVPERTTVGVHCMAATGNAAVNDTTGLPGPAALTQPETTIEVGL